MDSTERDILLGVTDVLREVLRGIGKKGCDISGREDYIKQCVAKRVRHLTVLRVYSESYALPLPESPKQYMQYVCAELAYGGKGFRVKVDWGVGVDRRSS